MDTVMTGVIVFLGLLGLGALVIATRRATWRDEPPRSTTIRPNVRGIRLRDDGGDPLGEKEKP